MRIQNRSFNDSATGLKFLLSMSGGGNYDFDVTAFTEDSPGGTIPDSGKD